MKRIIFAGAVASDLPAQAISIADKFQFTGRNMGNMLIGHSLREELVCDHAHFGTNLRPAQAAEEFDAIVVAAANFIFPGFDFGPLAQFIEDSGLPCVVAGLGAQAPNRTSGIGALTPGTQRFLSIISERSKTIGVRGHYTAEILARLGVRNTQPLGCPSLFRALRRDLRIIKSRQHSHALCVAINGSRNVHAHASSEEDAKRVEKLLLECARANNYEYILQNEFPEIEICAREEKDPAANDGNLDIISRRLRLDFGAADFRTLIERHFRVFTNIGEWESCIRTKHLSIGTRFHGNIIALTNGVPALIIAHDSRTLEMCELMHIPHVSIEDVQQIDPEAIYETIEFAAFEARYRKLYDSFAEFLDRAGLEHRLIDAQPSMPSGGALLAPLQRAAFQNAG